MPRSHPPTLLTLVKRTALDEGLFEPGERVLVAVSGGPDSMALLHALAHLRRKLNIELFAHGIDHGLRASAQAELALAAQLAARLEVPFSTTTIDVGQGSNLMARARTQRYAALREALSQLGGGVIATGHHADDRAETLIMRLLRGAGPAGLAVLPPRSGDLVRPLIRCRRSDILLHLSRHDISFAEDPSNRNPRFLRTRIRFEVLPLLAELSPTIVEHLSLLADAFRTDTATTAQDAHEGNVLGCRLGRAQRMLVAQALRQRNPRARIPLGQGAVARIDARSGQVVLTHEESLPQEPIPHTTRAPRS